MTNQQHPITPPPKLYGQWYDESPDDDELGLVEHVATQATRWGADQELEACCEWLGREVNSGWGLGTQLRAARRPKPPSLKEQALATLEGEPDDGKELLVFDTVQVNIIRRALEQLDD